MTLLSVARVYGIKNLMQMPEPVSNKGRAAVAAVALLIISAAATIAIYPLLGHVFLVTAGFPTFG